MTHSSDLVQVKAWYAEFKRKPLAMMTAYDVGFARLCALAKVDVILVGDSASNVMLGRSSTRDVGMAEMLLFVKAVVAGAAPCHVIADMPFDSDKDIVTAQQNAQLFMQAGAHSIKLEGAKVEVIRHLTQLGIPVIGHLGLLPQTAVHFHKVTRSSPEGQSLCENALAVQAAGACALVLEHLDFDLAKEVTDLLDIPTIGIGAGPHTDGQVLVLHDALGLSQGKKPPFAKIFAQVGALAQQGLSDYVQAVHRKEFPQNPTAP